MEKPSVEKNENKPIPEDWNMANISEIADIFDSLHRTPKYNDIGYSMVRVTDIRNGYLNLENTRRVTEDIFLEFTKKRIPQIGDLVFSRVGSYGQTSFVNTNEPFCLGQNTVLLVPKIHSRFLYYCLQSPSVKKQVEERVGGTSQKTISLQNIKSIVIPLPPKAIQVEIGLILSAYDDLIESNRCRIRLLEEMARALYREWFVHFRFPGHEDVEMVDSELGEIPEGWEIKPFSDIADFMNGYAFKPQHWLKEGKLIVKIAEMKNGLGGSSSFYHGDDIPERYHIDTGNLLFAWSASLCITFWTRGPALLNQHIFDVIPRDGFLRDFMYHSLSDSMERFKRLAQGATMTHIRRSALDEVCIAVPPPDTRNQFDYIVGKLGQLSINLEIQNRTLEKTRDLLLPKLVSGQTDVSDL